MEINPGSMTPWIRQAEEMEKRSFGGGKEHSEQSQRKASKNYTGSELRYTHRIWRGRETRQALGLTCLQFLGPPNLPGPSRTSGIRLWGTGIPRLITPAGFSQTSPRATGLRGLELAYGFWTHPAGGLAPGKPEAVDLGGLTC